MTYTATNIINYNNKIYIDTGNLKGDEGIATL